MFRKGIESHLRLLVCLVAASMAGAADIPQELTDAETKYAKAVVKALETAKGDAEARQKLADLNRSFVTHLKEIRPRVLARSAVEAQTVSDRIRVMETKLNAAREVTALDGRVTPAAIVPGPGAAKPPGKTPPPLGEAPGGELESRETGKKVKVGATFEMRGRTKNIPEGHAVQVFGVPNWGGLFPKESRKDPDKRFVVKAASSENWVGPVTFVLISAPEEVLREIDAWHVARRMWEEAGFPENLHPVFRGARAKNLYFETIQPFGALKLAEIKLEYSR